MNPTASYLIAKDRMDAWQRDADEDRRALASRPDAKPLPEGPATIGRRRWGFSIRRFLLGARI